MDSLEEIEGLVGSLDYTIQGIERGFRILYGLLFAGQTLERIPDEEFGPGLKGGGELFEEGFQTVLFVRKDIDDGSLGEDQFSQVLKDLLFF
jgi:hypothetical protein